MDKFPSQPERNADHVHFVSPSRPHQRLRSTDNPPSDFPQRTESLVSPLHAASTPPQPQHILLVDDSTDTLYVLSRVLHKAGYRTSAAESGRRAMQLLETTHFDLVILDVMMPEIDGLQLLRWMRANALLRQLPVILFTAMDAARLQDDARQLHVAGLFEKRLLNFNQILNATAQALARAPRIG